MQNNALIIPGHSQVQYNHCVPEIIANIALDTVYIIQKDKRKKPKRFSNTTQILRTSL
jgi:hypothetical protein